jgi:hypothetical protein
MAARAQVMVQGGGWRHCHWVLSKEGERTLFVLKKLFFYFKKNGLMTKAQKQTF